MFSAVLIVAASIVANTNSFVRDGVTYAQRGGMRGDTYIVTNVYASGSASILPRYLYALDFDDCYADDAAWYYAHADYSDAGRCSVRRSGNTVERNFDWKLNRAANFVVRVSASEDRFASIGVADAGEHLEDGFVRSRQPSRYYRCLPGHTVDGINSEGVFCSINVVGGDPWTAGWHTGGDIHPLGAVRWVLDNAKTAFDAATNLAARISFPQGCMQNFHYLVADEGETYIVENGSYGKMTGERIAMTNFRVLSDDSGGAGRERFNMLMGGSSISDVWYTRAYSYDTRWLSDFDWNETLMATSKVLWAQKTKEGHRGETVGGHTWWQTVHSSIYDIRRKTLKVAVQEVNDWYVFSIGCVNSVNGRTGAVSLDADSVGAIAKDDEHYLLYSDGDTTGLYMLSGDDETASDVGIITDGEFSQVSMYDAQGSVTYCTDGVWFESGSLRFPTNATDGTFASEEWVGGKLSGKLDNDADILKTNENFKAAVLSLSPPVELPSTGLVWNATAGKVRTANGAKTIGAADVGAFPKDGGTITDGNSSVKIDAAGIELRKEYGTYGDINLYAGEGVQVGGWFWRGTHFEYNGTFLMLPYGATGEFAVNSWSSLRSMLVDANTNANADCECISTNICKIIEPAITNAVIETRDRFYDEELDVTWKRTVRGGRIFYDVEAVGDSTGE